MISKYALRKFVIIAGCLSLILFLSSLHPIIVQAEDTGGGYTFTDFDELLNDGFIGPPTLGELQAAKAERSLRSLFTFMLGLVGISAFFMITLGGFQYATALGNPATITAAKGKIWGAFIGIVLAATSFLILKTINPDLVQLRVKAPAEIVEPAK